MACHPEPAGLAGQPLAGRIRWHGLEHGAEIHLRKRMRAGGSAAHRAIRPEHAGPGADQIRHRGTAATLVAPHPGRIRLVVPRLFRTRRGLGSGLGQDHGSTRRRQLHRQRPEDLDHAGPIRQHDLLPGAHVAGGPPPGRHQLLAHRHDEPRRGGPPDHHAGRRARSQRSVLLRRARPRRQPGGRGKPGLDLRQVSAYLRTHQHRGRRAVHRGARPPESRRPAPAQERPSAIRGPGLRRPPGARGDRAGQYAHHQPARGGGRGGRRRARRRKLDAEDTRHPDPPGDQRAEPTRDGPLRPPLCARSTARRLRRAARRARGRGKRRGAVLQQPQAVDIRRLQ